MTLDDFLGALALFAFFAFYALLDVPAIDAWLVSVL